MSITVSVELVSVTCGQCGGVYGIEAVYDRKCREEGRTWTCPYCKIGWGYVRSEVARLREQLDHETRRRELADAARLTAERGRAVLSGKLKRVRAGVCPDCKRSFANLRRHMQAKHGTRSRGDAGGRAEG